MNRRKFFHSAAVLPLLSAFESQSFAANLLLVSAPAAQGSVPMYDRYQQTLARVVSGTQPAYTDAFLLEDVRPTYGRRFTEYSGDVSGRYIGALSTAARVYGTSFPNLDPLVQSVLALQKPDGYFGSAFHYEHPTDLDLALLWGNGRLLVGLTEYYRLHPDPAVLAAGKRLGDFLVRIGPLMLSQEIRDSFGAQHFASSYICWTQQTEGLANLYQLTQDTRYRDLAESIFAVTERRPADHAHGYLSSIRGAVDLYNATQNPATLARAEAAWQDVATSKDLLITGGVPEGWSPNNHRTEGCGEADWLRLSLALWRATGKPKYLEMAERTLFNEFSFNQYQTGDFGHRVFTETGLPAAGAVRAWWCCSLHGLRTFPDIQSTAFSLKDQSLSYDLPVDAASPDGAFAATAHSKLAQDGTITLTVRSAPTSSASFLIRQPQWAQSLTIQLNGKPQTSTIQNGYAKLSRQWKKGDMITAQYAMSLRSEPAAPNRTAYFHGPWLLGAPASENAVYFNELTLENKLAARPSATVAPRSAAAESFAVPAAAHVFPFISAEFADQSTFVTLRAIAEQGGQPTTSWELRFLTQATT